MNRLSPISLSHKEDVGASKAALRRWVFTVDSRCTPLEASFAVLIFLYPTSFSLEKRTQWQMVALVKMVAGGDNFGMVALVEMVVADISLSLTVDIWIQST
uniref:Uncharacterized protein n=1 Tax=Cannabis sativa TaxID=3483 RepID=A0A803PR69_CANSA